ncbi:MAG: DUF2203 domain-containing protein [Myxococcota bacterium]
MESGFPTRLYAPDEADQLVPHLERVFAAIGEHQGIMRGIVERLAAFGVDLGKAMPAAAQASAEVTTLIDQALTQHRFIVEQMQSLAELGVEVKALDGLCDVRSEHDGRIVYLCWRRGEPAFGHWHEIEAGFAGRQPIVERSDFQGTLLN